jgi:hypothetical protein
MGGLNSRDRRNLAKKMGRFYEASVGVYRDPDFDERVLQTACGRLLLPIEQAREAIAHSYGEIPSPEAVPT